MTDRSKHQLRNVLRAAVRIFDAAASDKQPADDLERLDRSSTWVRSVDAQILFDSPLHAKRASAAARADGYDPRTTKRLLTLAAPWFYVAALGASAQSDVVAAVMSKSPSRRRKGPRSVAKRRKPG